MKDLENYKKSIPFFSINSIDEKCFCGNFLRYRICKYFCSYEIVKKDLQVII